ncbi:MAG: hypothetical protein J7M21_06800, partial [Planctomycetes bacterium]|nr:hypothetical protein [Planctomycetota bacterium]
DAEGLFKRYQKRVRREIQGYLMNLLFIRIPLFDPDHFLNAWVGAVGWLFSWFGFVLWAGLLAVGMYFVIGNWSDLYDRAEAVLDVENLPFLYLSFVIIKVAHEFGHAFMCKTFGRRTGTGGEVHVMGVMFLVFTPLPYVDASSAWAFRSRRQRILVGLGGMLIELGLAAVAAIVWANVSPGTLRTICYNAMFVASVSTVLFNANPLLRYDGYYILSDILEIPNLAQRSKQYIYYLVKKYIWNVRQARDPGHTRGEKAWFIFYGVASTIYRVFICIRILLFVASKLFMVGVILAIAAAVAWVLVPLGRFVHYLFTSGELMRVRGRAMATTGLTVGLIVVGVGLVPYPDRFRIEGVVEPARLQVVHTAADGFVRTVLSPSAEVSPDGPPLLTAASADLDAQLAELQAQRRQLEARRRLAQTKEQASAQILAGQIAALDDKIDQLRRRRDALTVRAAFTGQWISPHVERLKGAYLRRGRQVGLLASRDVIVRATAGQDVVDMLLAGETDEYTLMLPRDELPGLLALRDRAERAGRPLSGFFTLRGHAAKAVRFVVEDVPPAAGPPASGPASMPASAAAPRPAGKPASAAPTVPVAIRLKDASELAAPLLVDQVSVTIAGRDFGLLPARRRVKWREVELRIKGRPSPLMTGTIVRIIEAGSRRLPSAALGYAAGGSVPTDPKDPNGVRAAERFFEIQIAPNPVEDRQSIWYGRVPLLAGQRVVIRLAMPPRPLASQWYRSLLQLVQRRFRI